MSVCLHPIDHSPFQHDPGGALLNMGLSDTQLWQRAMALLRDDPLQAEHLQAAIHMRLTERSGWIAVRTPKFPASDLAGAAQAALAICAYYHDLGDMTSAHVWVRRAVAKAPAGTNVAIAARISVSGW
jgi:hypothetical protein